MGKDRTKSEVQKVDGVQALMNYTEDNSLDVLKTYVVVPFVKLIHGTTADSLKEKFGEGSVIVTPGDTKIIDKNGKFLFVPLFFFTVYRQWADRKDTRMIVESTYEIDSVVAKKSRDPEAWSEVYEEDRDKPEIEQRFYRYVEHLCFIGLIHDGELVGTKCLISFQKSDFRVGRSFASAAQMRKVEMEDGKRQQVPLWAQVHEISIGRREKGGNKWWGFDVNNPPDGIDNMIQPDDYAVHAEAYKELVEAHAANRIRVDGEVDPDEATNQKASSEF